MVAAGQRHIVRQICDGRERSSGRAGGRGTLIQSVGRINPRSIAVADLARDIADEQGAMSAQVAIAWTLANPAVAAPVIGARSLRQLEDNLGALDVTLDADALARLDVATAIELWFPHDFLRSGHILDALTGGTSVAGLS